MKRLLITFGCSWTWGLGAGYKSGMSDSEYREMAWNAESCDPYSFRTLLCRQFGLENKNLSFCGSSNQAQFRQAKLFFSSQEFTELQKQFDQIFVLWGITSTARNEFYNLETKKIKKCFYTDDSWPFCKYILKYVYDHEHEVDLLATEIHHWNLFFKNLKISNLWFDTFNHHDYVFPATKIEIFKQDYEKFRAPDWPSWEEYRSGHTEIAPNIWEKINDTKHWQFRNEPIKNLIFESKNPRDLLSLLSTKHGLKMPDRKMHYSNWNVDSNRVKFLVDCDILNPISQHPTIQGHESIAELLTAPLETLLKNKQ
jgi:hypothetical protein